MGYATSPDTAIDAASDFEQQALRVAIKRCDANHTPTVYAHFMSDGSVACHYTTASRTRCLCDIGVVGDPDDPDFALARLQDGEWKFEPGSHPELSTFVDVTIGRRFPSTATI